MMYLLRRNDVLLRKMMMRLRRNEAMFAKYN